VGLTASHPSKSKAVVSTPQRVEYRGTGLGTSVHLVAYTNEVSDRASVEAAFRSAIGEMARLDSLLSEWRQDSDVGRINTAQGEFVVVSEETIQVIDQSLWAGKLSGGALDITFQSLGHLWRFGDAAQEVPRPPSEEQVRMALFRVDFRKVALDAPGRRVRIGVEQKIGLGGVAKGYIVDRMAERLSRAKVESFLVQAGGDLYAAGVKPGGVSWEAGVQDPRQPEGNSFAKLPLTDRAFSTAGDYARAFIVDGRRYHHIIDPKTGFSSSACRSVTIWAKTALLADALDDAVFVLGPEEGLKLVESLPDVGAVIVGGDNRLWVSQRLRDKLKISHLPRDGL
jgi:thiamine biosynthesis lipoprotein